MKVLVIGGGGYVGSVLVEELLERGYAVKVFDRLFYGDYGLKDIRNKIELVVGDMRTMGLSVLKGVDAVINVGGLSNDPTAEYNPKANYEMNTLATEHSAKLCKHLDIRRYIYASSCSIYDFGIIEPDNDILANEDTHVNPQAAYSLSKYEGERRLLKLVDNHFSPVILRKGTVFGFSPRMRFDLVVNTFVKDALRKGAITVFYGGEMWRPLVSVRDVARCYIACLEANETKIKGQIFNLVYKNYRISELALRVREALKEIGIEIEIITDYRYKGVRNYRVSSEKIQRILDIRPVISVEESVKEMVEKIRQYEYTDFDNPKYYNIRWLKFLEETNEVIKHASSIFDLSKKTTNKTEK